jgi:endonuclease YncB( thermonuclease family)
VIDGKTIVMEDGSKIHLAQMDAPFLSQCYGANSRDELEQLLPVGTVVRLKAEPKLTDVDQSGRLVRYIFSSGKSVSLAMIQAGAAEAYFPDNTRGQYAKQLLAATLQAKHGGTGMWGKCNYVVYPYGRVGQRPS